MAVTYKMRALTQSTSNYVYWTSANEPDITGSEAPVPVVADTITILGSNGYPGGDPQQHDLTHSPVGLWQLDGDYTDSSGNGFNLTSTTGALTFTDITPGIGGLGMWNGAAYRSTPDAALTITGAITIECFARYFTTNSSFVGYVYGSASETEANNGIYLVDIRSGQYVFESEYDAGVNQTAYSGISATSELVHLAFIRETDDSFSFYLNGEPRYNGGSVHSTGGTTSYFWIGRTRTVSDAYGIISSVKIIDGALSASDVKAEYNRTLGPLLGII